MRKLSKLLVLVLSLALLVGAIFAVNSFAADGDGLDIEGAERTVIDFEGLKFDKHSKVIGDTAAVPKTSVGTDPFHDMVSDKYGHLRTVTTPDGNTWYEWLFEEAYTSNAAASDDSVLAITRGQKIADLSYYIQEYDLSTRTEIPGKMSIFFEMRAWHSGAEDRANFRNRPVLATYDTTTNLWTAPSTGKTFTTDANEWVHVTLVAKIVKEFSTGEDGAQLVNYSKSTMNLYIDGELMATSLMVNNANIPADADVQIYYLGPGYGYGTPHTGAAAGDGVVIDNVVKTTIPTAYAADAENDDLAALFAAENPVTNCADISTAIVYGEDYELPETELGVAAYVPEEGEEYVAATIEDALQMLKDDENEGATIKLYANRYKSVNIDYPCVIDLNGFALQNEYTHSGDLVASYDAEAGEITFEYDLENSATFNYYNVAYADIGTASPVKTQIIVAGNAFVPALNPVDLVPVTINGNTGVTPTGAFKIYDANGAEVTITEIGDANKGQIYTVCPEIATYTFESNIAFYVLSKTGVATFFDSNDILAAATNGYMPGNSTVILLQDCVFSSTLVAPKNSTLSVDLNGYKLTAAAAAGTYLAGAKSKADTNVDYFFYTSKDGGTINTNGFTLIRNQGYDDSYCSSYFFGYTDAATKATGRMIINFGSKVVYMNKRDADSVMFYNCEMHATGTWALFEMAQARMDYIFEIDTCDVFTDGYLVAANANSTNCDLTIKNSNIYGAGKDIFTAPAGTAAGSRDVILINSKLYNFEYGATTISSLTMDATSMISCEPTLKNTIAGKTVLCKPEVVTINGTTYFTGYQWVAADTQYATFNYYNVPVTEVTADTVPVKTYKIAVGSWWISLLNGDVTGKYYDPTVNPNVAYLIKTYDGVFDTDKNKLTQTALTAEDAGKTFYICADSVLTDETVAVNPTALLQLADGSYVPVEGDNLSAALKAAFESATLPTGSTLVLLSDFYYTETVNLEGCKIDLNGKTLYVKTKGPGLWAGTKDVDIFIYSSQPGARVFSIPQDNPGSTSYFLEVRSTGIEVFLGYVNKETKSPYRIEAFSGAFIQDQGGSNSTINIANFDIFGLGGDNYGMFNIRGGGTVGVTYNFYNCTIRPDNRNPIFCLREATEGTFNVYDTDIYVTAGAGRQLIGWYGNRDTECKATVTLTNSNLYGLVLFNEAIAGKAVATIYVNEGCTLPFTLDFDYNTASNFVFPEGYMAIPQEGTITVPTNTIPKSGQYGNEDTTYGGQELAYTAVVGVKPTFDTNAYKAQAFQNMTLDTNVVGNLYIPVDSALKVLSATFNGNNLLDETAIEIINGKEYYVITVEVAPKYGNLTATIVVSFEYGYTAEFAFSVANYAKALFALDGTNNAYVADSQTMMKYVLAYIKEVAVAFGGADANLFADLGDIAVDTNKTVTEEVKNTAAINTYVTHAALDLDAYAGFAFKVAAGFVGTVRVEMAGVEAVEKTYTAEAPAGEMEVLVLENVPAYLFRGDVTITVTPAEGAAVTAQFNLATYVTANADEAYAKALYAYTVEAAAYNTKYPTVNTVN